MLNAELETQKNVQLHRLKKKKKKHYLQVL